MFAFIGLAMIPIPFVSHPPFPEMNMADRVMCRSYSFSDLKSGLEVPYVFKTVSSTRNLTRNRQLFLFARNLRNVHLRSLLLVPRFVPKFPITHGA
jgi:hypothetical protein